MKRFKLLFGATTTAAMLLLGGCGNSGGANAPSDQKPAASSDAEFISAARKVMLDAQQAKANTYQSRLKSYYDHINKGEFPKVGETEARATSLALEERALGKPLGRIDVLETVKGIPVRITDGGKAVQLSENNFTRMERDLGVEKYFHNLGTIQGSGGSQKSNATHGETKRDGGAFISHSDDFSVP
jgi:hypothetical protein